VSATCHPVVIAGLTLMLLMAARTIGDTATIKIDSGGTDDIVGTVYDMNAQAPGMACANRRINGFATRPAKMPLRRFMR
jgi:hypothetical protein